MSTSAGARPSRVTLVVGTTAGGTGAHVAMLAAGLAAAGSAVTVAGPAAAAARFAFGAGGGVSFVPVAIGARPRAGDLAVLARLRRLLSRREAGAVAHAHGLRAGALTVLALVGVRGPRRPGLVVTVHNAPPRGRAAAVVYGLLERVVARGADLVLSVSPDLEARMRGAGARRTGRAVVAAPDPREPAPGPAPGGPGSRPAPGGPGPRPAPGGPGPRPAARSGGRPVVLAAGRLTGQKGLDVLLEAAAGWRDLDPPPRLVIAGDGPLAGPLRDQARALGVDASFPGHVGDLPARLAGAAVFVLPSRWEGQPLVLQEALRAGRPVVASRAGGIAELAGPGAALLVPPGEAGALADAVRAVLTDPLLAARLAAAAAARGRRLPSPADAVAAAARAYAGLATAGPPAASRLR